MPRVNARHEAYVAWRFEFVGGIPGECRAIVAGVESAAFKEFKAWLVFRR